MKTLAALDLETTGLDPERDAIIEIGVVRFRGARVEQEWSTLVNPGRPLPAFISQLTGISDDMLSSAPRITQVLDDLAQVVGDAPVLGHNVAFDLSFLKPRGLFEFNLPLDTYDLAGVILPTAPRYDLASLASLLGVPVRQTHRALEDAQTTHQVFLTLFEMAEQLPLELVEEIARLGAEIEWGAGWVFDEVLERMLSGALEPRPAGERADPLHAAIPPGASEVLSPVHDPEPIDPEEVAAPLEPAGELAKYFSEYEHRPQQIKMLKAIAEALSEGQHLLVEAGTGIGKSMAYLLPAFAWAAKNGQRVIVSTNTINLQDQLIHKDVPDLCAALGLDFRAAVLKGRANYICPRRLDSMRKLGVGSSDELRVLAKVLVWMAQGGSGDRTQITLRGVGESLAWSKLSAEGEECVAERCLFDREGMCPYYFARQTAESAHVVIVNHALLLADIVTGNRVIPDYEYLIVDEAHHLESATTSGLSQRVSENEIARLLRDLGPGRRGLLGRILTAARGGLSNDLVTEIESALQGIAENAQQARERAGQFFHQVGQFLVSLRGESDSGPYGQRERVVGSTRTLPEWSEIEMAWENLRGPLSILMGSLTDVSEGLLSLSDEGRFDGEELGFSLRSAGRSLAEMFDVLEGMIFEPDPRMIYWIETRPSRPSPALHAAPLEVGPLVERFLWHEKQSVIMTSATLTTSGDFDYIRKRLSAYDANELALGSPFDYETSTLLYLINDIPEPTAQPAYQRAVERGLIELCKTTQGRALVLFTSYAQLRRTSEAISGPLSAAGILVLEQGEGSSRHALLETFRTGERTVLLGTRSFWEGVDVPGEALSVLAMIRIPFDVPSDPIVAARSEMYEFPFNEYSVPEAILRFRQGFGRLIRTASDRGIVVAFDRRLLSKAYGRAFIDSLPRTTLRTGRLDELPAAAARWLGL